MSQHTVSVAIWFVPTAKIFIRKYPFHWICENFTLQKLLAIRYTPCHSYTFLHVNTSSILCEISPQGKPTKLCIKSYAKPTKLYNKINMTLSDKKKTTHHTEWVPSTDYFTPHTFITSAFLLVTTGLSARRHDIQAEKNLGKWERASARSKLIR